MRYSSTAVLEAVRSTGMILDGTSIIGTVPVSNFENAALDPMISCTVSRMRTADF